MTRRYDVRTGMLEHDPDAELPREQLLPGWRVPGYSRYDYDLRIGDAERQVDALAAKTQRHIDSLMADLPRPPKAARDQSQQTALDQDASRFVVLAVMLFMLATWVLMLAWMSRHAYYGPYPQFPGPPGH